MKHLCENCKHKATFECGLSYDHIHKNVKGKYIEIPVKVINEESWEANKDGKCKYYKEGK